MKVYDTEAPKNIKELKKRIEMVINDMNVTGFYQVRNLYNSIRGRLCDVILRRGERINY